MESPQFLLVAIAGPTGSGKSALGLTVAAEFGGEIVNYDSVQVYRGLDIGSAKTPAREQRGIPHHLIDVLEPEEELTAGEFARRARALVLEIAERGRLPVLVGGTGFYLRALLDGLPGAPGRNSELRKRLAELSERRPAALHRFLRRADPARAAQIHANDLQKLMRAIELVGAHTAAPEPLVGFQIVKIGLRPERNALYASLNERTARMFDCGLLEETEALLRRGVSPQAKPLQTLGYKQAVKILGEEMPRQAAILECQTKTRQYAKRQLTWLRAERDVLWLNGFGDDPVIQRQALLEVCLRNRP